MRSSYTVFFLFVLLLPLVTGCDSTSSSELVAPKVRVTLDLDGLTPLSEGFKYQVWARDGFTNIAGETFNINDTGSYINPSGQVIQPSFVFPVDVTAATALFITIEDRRDSDDTPSSTVLMAGDLSSFQATLSPAHPLAIGSSLTSEGGTFMLMTPSDGVGGNETSGLWFATGARSSLSAGLNLPSLPDGWAYEGWVETADGQISIGAFQQMDDHDFSRLYSLPDTPPFPGEDFIQNPPEGFTFPLDLAGAQVSISVEPFPDDSSQPFGFRILSGSVPANPASDTAYALSPDYQAPSGTARLF
ncbi:MAG: hypothetical protein O3A57_00295 [Bacteroidetes bacterium]|nr:hypothetical protein [Bacteroidota bacterium]